MTIPQKRLLPLTLVVALLCRSASGIPAEQPWDAAPFSAGAADIASAVKQVSESRAPGVVVLLDETRISLDSTNRATETHHTLYRIGTQSPGDWGAVGATWQPWRQQKPAIRARVITSDGREIRFDDKSLSESPLSALGLDTFGDGRLLHAPLPALSAGSVVELETVVEDKTSLFNRGIALTVNAGREVPVLRSSITIEAPQSSPLKYEVLSLPEAATADDVAAGRRTVKVAIGKLDALEARKVLPPSGEYRRPRVSFSTAASWRETADAYAQVSNGAVNPASVAAIAKQTVGDALNREQIVDRILQKVQRTIRYSAVQLGEAAIVPTAPLETLKLEYGDCKDQAALLIAMLRASGVDAYMALLKAGPEPDVNPNLPGFGGFDHAIVYVPGANPLWLDSTTRFSRAGQLPLADQGRLALIVKPDTTELIRTPEYVSRIVESQEVFLAENGPGKVTAAREFSGREEIETRMMQNEIAISDLQKAIEQVSDPLSGGQSIRNISRTDPSDFSIPYKLQFELVGSRYATTSGNQAAVFILLQDLLSETGFGSIASADDKLIAEGVRFPERLARQWSYRIVPPSGYSLGEIPPKRTVKFGPATLTQEFLSFNDGTVTGTILFDSGKRNYSAAELADMKSGLGKMMKDTDSVLTVSFDLTAQKNLEAGKFAEALKEFRRLIALHPDEAIHHSQFARALLSMGMGESARLEARKAVELEPKSAVAYDTLGEILEFDLIGRRWRSGFELDEARDAYRKAVELAPTEDSYRGDLAITLELNAKGIRYAPGVDLNPAIEQYQLFKEKPEESSSLYRNLPVDLFRMGKFDELRNSNTPSDIRIAAIAATDSVTAAVREAAKLNGDARTKALNDAAAMLLLHRRYAESAGLMKAAGGTNPALGTSNIATLETVRKFEDLPMPSNDPKSVAKSVIVRIILQDRGSNLSSLLTPSGREELRRHPDSSFGGLRIETTLLRGIESIPSEAIADIYISTTGVSQEGDDKGGYRIEFSATGPSRYQKRVFVVQENGQYRAVSVIRNDFAVAREALRLIDKGDLENARRWMDWIEDEQDSYANDEIGILVKYAFDQVWNTGIRKDRDRMRYAAAVALSSSPDDAARILPILQEGIIKNTGAVQTGISEALANALLTLKRFDESAAAGMKALKSSPHSDVVKVVAQSMLELNRRDELLKILKDSLKDSTHTEWVLQTIAAIYVQNGNFAEAEKVLIGGGEPGLSFDTSIGWLSQYHSAITEDDVARVQKSVETTRNTHAPLLKTLAALKAETEKPAEAFELLKLGLSISGGDIENGDWYVIGRIYEQYGEREAAATAYRKVTPSAKYPLLVNSAYTLAQKRLAAVR